MTVTMKSPAIKFRKIAEGMPAKIEHLRRPMTQNSTPKRNREYSGRCIDGDNLDRGRLALLALADAWDRDDVPEVLRDINTRDAVCRLVRHGSESNGYYDVHSTYKYADNSEAGKALQGILDAYMGKETKKEHEATKKKRELERMIDRIRFIDMPGFFPTPLAVIEKMIDRADVRSGMKVLEPSAGIGSICDALDGLEVDLVCCEVRPSLCDILTAKGYKTVNGDFLERFSLFDPIDNAGEVGPEMRQFDRVLMNPPFEDGQDMDHVRHAFKVLKPGGRLVSIVSPGPFFRETKKAADFRAWVDTFNVEVVDLDTNSFSGAGAFRSTGTACKMLVADKPCAA